MSVDNLIQRIHFDEAGLLRVETGPGHKLLGEYLVSDLWALGVGPYYQEVRDSAVRGLKGESSDEILGNAFAVEVAGQTSTLTLLVRPEVDLRLGTKDLLAAVDAVASAVREGRSAVPAEPVHDL